MSLEEQTLKQLSELFEQQAKSIQDHDFSRRVGQKIVFRARFRQAVLLGVSLVTVLLVLVTGQWFSLTASLSALFSADATAIWSDKLFYIVGPIMVTLLITLVFADE